MAHRAGSYPFPAVRVSCGDIPPPWPIVDEAAWVADSLIAACKPMLAVSGGDLIAMSTSKARVGWFYETWTSDEPEPVKPRSVSPTSWIRGPVDTSAEQATVQRMMLRSGRLREAGRSR
jgi:hypothetical protein